MRSALVAITALLIAASILISGNALQNTLLSVRADLEGFALFQIGLLQSSYFVGFIVGCRVAPIFVGRVGHIRTFTALASIASASALTHVIFVDLAPWIALRAVTGLCMAGLQMILESWINERADNANRGKVLAVYRIADLGASTIGNILLTVSQPEGFVLFAMISILFSISLVPVALTTSVAPKPIASAKLNLAKLFRVSPLAAFGTISVGAANGAFWSVGPVFVQRLGYDVSVVAVFMSAVIIGGGAAQWPVGWASDNYDRRKVLLALGVFSAASSVLLAQFGGAAFLFLIGFGAAFGVCVMPMFGQCIAHAIDHAQPEEYVEVTGGLFLLYGVGSIIGPLAAPLLMEAAGAPFLFYYTAVVYGAFFLFGLYRLTQRASVPMAEQEAYVPLPETTPNVFEMDPRAEDAETRDASPQGAA